MEHLSAKFAPQISEIFPDALHLFMTARGVVLTSSILSAYLSTCAEHFDNGVFSKSNCMKNCVAFTDGTVISIARSGSHNKLQHMAYNGHKRKHVLKFRAITTPDGIGLHLYGPKVGRRHDIFLYAASSMGEMLPTLTMVQGKQYDVFGDSGCSWRVYPEVPLGGANLDDVRSAFNKTISKAHISVEWYFMELKRLWGLVDAKHKLRIRQMPAELIYRAAVLLTNFHNCARANGI